MILLLSLLTTPASQPPSPAALAVCDTRNTSITAIVVTGAGTAAVNGKYLRTESGSDGLPIFSLDDTHQLYSRDYVWRIAFKGDYLFYISGTPHLMGPPKPSPGEWSASGQGEGNGPSSIVCELAPPPSPPPSPSPSPSPTPPAPAPPANATDLVLEFVPGSQWESFNYPGCCTRHKKEVGPDSMVIAWYNRNKSIAYLMASNHRHMNAGIGTSIDNISRCNAGPVFFSVHNSTPQSYANNQWLQSVRVFANGTLAGLVHNEFHGDLEGPPFCRHRYKRGQPFCGIWSTGLAIATDGGGHFDLIAHPPHHLVAALPYTYLANEPTAGYGAISSMLRGADGAFYGSINVIVEPGCNATTQPLCGRTKAGNCLWRAANLFDPASFRGRDSAGNFSVQWLNPYLEHPSTTMAGICDTLPVTNESVLGMHVTFRKIVFPKSFAQTQSQTQTQTPTYIALSDANIIHENSTGGFHSKGMVRYSFSSDPDFGSALSAGMSRWSKPKYLDLQPPPHVSGDYKYPTLIDSRSPELGRLGGTVESGEDGDSFALASASAGEGSASSLYVYVQWGGKGGGNMRRNVHLRMVPRA